MTDGPGIPDFAAAREHVLREVVRLVRRLRAAGVAVPANGALPAVEALAQVGLSDRERVRTALAAALLGHPRERDPFDEHFGVFWERLRAGLEAAALPDAPDPADDGGVDARLGSDAPAELAEPTLEADDPGGEGAAGGDADLRTGGLADADAPTEGTAEDRRTGTYSSAGDRTAVDGASAASDVDRAAVGRFEDALATLSGRRWSRADAGDAVDVRRALRESVDSGGVPTQLPRREREPDAYRACVLVDVSRSVLDAVDRDFLLGFVRALVADGRSVRAFFFDTEIREVTDAFDRAGASAAAALAEAEVAWGGGTRIGDSLSTLRTRWPDAVDNRTVTLVVSDGLDVGDVDDLERGMAWLARRSRAVLWLNPLATSAAYEPTCRGMAAALPYVDGLFAFGGDEDLTEAARQLARHGATGPVGYEHDFRSREVES